MKVIIIIPAFNEEKNIKILVEKLLNLDNFQTDVLVINDCSCDNTSQMARESGAKVIDLPCNLGIGGAVQTGYKYAYKHNYDIAVQIDGDGQHNPVYIKTLIEPLIHRQADLVIGSRFIEKNGFQSTFARRLGINFLKKFIQILIGQKISDPTSGFRACNSKIIRLFANKYPTDYPEPESIVFLKKNNFRIMEVPVIMNKRLEGKSSIVEFMTVYYMIKVTLAILIEMLREYSLERSL